MDADSHQTKPASPRARLGPTATALLGCAIALAFHLAGADREVVFAALSLGAFGFSRASSEIPNWKVTAQKKGS